MEYHDLNRIKILEINSIIKLCTFAEFEIRSDKEPARNRGIFRAIIVVTVCN